MLHYESGSDVAQIHVSSWSPWTSDNMFILVEGTMSAFGWGPGDGESEGGGPSQLPETSNAISFNHNRSKIP